MSIYANVIADSIYNGKRLTTMEVNFHRFILPQLLTHRNFSRSFSSSRAVPIQKMIDSVRCNPATPLLWGSNKAGMIAGNTLPPLNQESCELEWADAAIAASDSAEYLMEQGLHKQVANRLLEPFLFVRGIVSATEWDNFFKLRLHHAAQPEIQELARVMKEAMDGSTPTELKEGLWHLPYIQEWEEMELEDAIKCSVARCARVSYLKHDGGNPSMEDDLHLYNQLVTRPFTDKRGTHYGEDEPVHLSPTEHIATPIPSDLGRLLSVEGVTHIDRSGEPWSGNFKGWVQYRQLL